MRVGGALLAGANHVFVVFRQVDVKEQRGGRDHAYGDARCFSEALVAGKAPTAKGEGNRLSRLQEERVGAAVAAGSDDDLRSCSARRGHGAHVLGCQVGDVGRQDQDFCRAACDSVSGSLRQCRVELKFKRNRMRLDGVSGQSRIRGFFDQRMASRARCCFKRLLVPADDNDFSFDVRQADGAERVRE